MATYKVIQDIEAEDKFLGPLTLKQFIFGAGGVLFGYLSFFAAVKGALWALGIFLPPMFLGVFLAVPWSKDQSTEVWVLAKLRFRIKPKKRIWNQAGLEELVTITVPKKIEKHLTNNLGQEEVRSRLKALATTIDTRGWAVKHAATDPGFSASSVSDRLVNPASLPREVPAIDLAAMPDVMDDNTAVSSNFDHMIQQSEQLRLQQNLDKMEKIRQGVPLEQIKAPEIRFTPPPTNYQTPYQQVPNIPVTDEDALTAELKAKQAAGDIATSHMHSIGTYNPYAPDPTQTPVPQSVDSGNDKAQASIPTTPDPAILDLARNDDLNVATIARQAKKANDDEVVVSLH